MHESQMHEKNSFLTLTYKELPFNDSLDPTHFRNFIKRVRTRLSRQRPRPAKIRYLHCGEYGDQTWRPHYHAIIFGEDWSADRTLLKHNKYGDPIYVSKLLTSDWTHGFASIGHVTKETCGYVAKYVMKKITGENSLDHYGVLHHPYQTMSLKPGIGETWFKKYMADVYPSDEVIVDGKSCRPPKYYDTLYERLEPQKFKSIQRERKRNASKYASEQTPERLKVKEEISILRDKSKRNKI